MEFFEIVLAACVLVFFLVAYKDLSGAKGYRLIGSGVRNKELENIPGYRYYSYADLSLSPAHTQLILEKHFPYYRNLDAGRQARFLRRVQRFLHAKMFVLPEQHAYREMPILAAATAVQLTFGKKKFLFEPYHYIRFHAEEYFKEGTFSVLAGHVYGNTITLAWNFFLYGVKMDSDGQNVGLHEMAHAFELCYLRDNRRHRDHYEFLCSTADRYITQYATDQNDMFSDYACKSKHEFIAETVELFFERSVELRERHPQVYQCMSNILNQDPAAGKTAPRAKFFIEI